MHYVYILRCCDGRLYVGYTQDLVGRLDSHNAGQGAAFTRQRRPVQMVYSESFDADVPPFLENGR